MDITVRTEELDRECSDNGDGTFFVREQFKKGTFVTTGPVSPGACEADSRHGALVSPGVEGSFNGYLEGTVTGGAFDPNGCTVAGAICNTTAGFAAAVFPGGQFTCVVGGGVCTFKFEYAAGDQGLIYHHWEDKSSPKDPSVEVFKGDIATS